jgi:hypothetical protein
MLSALDLFCPGADLGIIVEKSVHNHAESKEMSRFSNALRRIVQIPKSELDRLLEEKRRSKTGKTKPSLSLRLQLRSPLEAI